MDNFSSKSYSQINISEELSSSYSTLHATKRKRCKAEQDEGNAKNVSIKRPVVLQITLFPTLHEHMDKGFSTKKLGQSIQSKCSCDKPSSLLFSLFPILSWLSKYRWKTDTLYDVIAGFTVAVMHIPQGMAYALLANIPPICGIYMAFFPVIIYAIMGTSRHVSMGTFAVICLMAGQVASKKSSLLIQGIGTEESNETHSIQIVTVLTFIVGIWQVFMGLTKLGSLSKILSPALVSGFTTGAAFHVLTSQVKHIFGLTLPKRYGIFKIPLTYADIFNNIFDSNIVAIIFSLTTISILAIYNEVLKPRMPLKVPVPVELITVAIGTFTSYFWDMDDTFDLAIVKSVPTGLPMPTLPQVELMRELILDGFIISVVSYAISISMAKIFASKHNYTVHANQELIANGTSNVVGSFFMCAPFSASLSRSLIQEQVGGRTQLASLFSCAILLPVMLWIGPLFQPLPYCVLGALIVVALKGMFLQLSDLPNAWNHSKLDGLIWLITFVSTIGLDIEYGLGVGVVVTLFGVFWAANQAEVATLGCLSGTDIFIPIEHCDDAKEYNHLKILKLTGNLNFSNVDHFIDKIQEIMEAVLKNLRSGAQDGDLDENSVLPDDHSLELTDELAAFHLILDMSSVCSIDPTAVKALGDLQQALIKENVSTMFSSCGVSVLKTFEKCADLHEYSDNHFYASIKDVIVACS